MPDGGLLKKHFPNSEMKVVSSLLVPLSEICQNPELASGFENTFASWGSPSVCSTVGMECHFLKT